MAIEDHMRLMDLERRQREREMDHVVRQAQNPPERRAADWNAIAFRELMAQQGFNLTSVIKKRIEDLEEKLEPGEELAVYCDTGRDRIRVQSFEFPNWHLGILSGYDEFGNATQRIANIQNIELTCKVMKTNPPSRPPKIGFVLPEQKKDTINTQK